MKGREEEEEEREGAIKRQKSGWIYVGKEFRLKHTDSPESGRKASKFAG